LTVLVRARLHNLGLLALSLLALGLVMWTARAPTSLERQVRERHLLELFRREDVQRIEVHQGERATVVVHRPQASGAHGLQPAEPTEPDEPTAEPDEPAARELEPGAPLVGADDEQGVAEWSLSEPFETDADNVPIDRLLGSLQYATWERAVDTATADASSALAAHELVVAMSAVTYRLRLGGDAVSPPGARYVQVMSGSGAPRTYVVKRRVVEDLFVEGDSFRGRQIVPYRKGSIARVVLSSAAGVRRLRREKNAFLFDGMQENQRADHHALDRIFLGLARASAEPFVNVDVAKAAIASDSSVRVSLVPVAPNKAEASLEFGGRCPSNPELTLAIRHLPEPIAGCVERSVLLALREPASSLIDRHPFSFDADEVDTVRLVEGDAVLEFARGGDGFVLKQPRPAAIDPEAAKDRLTRILETEGELLMASRKPPDAAGYSAATITLETSARPGEERSTESVRVSASLPDGSHRIFREADGAVLLISAESALALRADATLLKEHKVFDYPLAQVRRVDVNYGNVKQTLDRNADGVLSLSAPKGFDVDGSLAVDLIDQLRTLRALRWVSDRASTGFGLDKPRATVHLSVEVDGTPIERTLLIGSRAPGGYHASVDRDPGVFVVPRTLERVLGTWLLDRAVFRADRDAIVELSLDAEGLGSVQLKRVAGELTLQKGPSGFDTARADELLDAIESLRTESAVHLGPATASEGLRRPILTGTIRRQSPENVGIPPMRFSIGSRDSFRDASIFYARASALNATYALPREQVQRLLDLF
jgi:Domain of unknown function (DUF4340)